MNDTPNPQQTAAAKDDVAKLLYEQNVELTLRNRMFTLLRKLYEIINTSSGVKETAQRIIDSIVIELKFQGGFIGLIDRADKQLKIVAASSPSSIRELAMRKSVPVESLMFPLTDKENYCVASALDGQRRMTNFLSDIMTPLVDEQTAENIQKERALKTALIFPLKFAGSVLGIMELGMDKHIGDLSRIERETMHELIDVVTIAIDRAQNYAELQSANDQLKNMDRLKNEFVSVTSHELRTPMTAIKSYAWMVIHGKAGEINPKAFQYIERVYLSTERLINLVNDMLDVSRIESGKVLIKKEVFDIAKLAEDLKNEFSAKSQEKNIQLVLDNPRPLPPVAGDREKIHQVFENLIGNAFKFTPSGGTITLIISEEGDFMKITVQDTGKGISREDIPRLFSKFGRLQSSFVSVSENAGTGLGLYICKQYVEMNGGTIHAESEVGKGARLVFTLPKATEKDIPKK